MITSHPNLVPLSTSDPEYDKIVKQVLSEYPRACICMIDSVVNPPFTDLFQRKQKEFEARGIPSQAIRVYHGTNSQAAASILKGGFDPRYGTVMAYGKGIYFARNFTTSYVYSKENPEDTMSYMFVCSILPGRIMMGAPNRDVPDGYESQGNAGTSVESTTVFSIPEADQMIPLYLVRFHKQSESGAVEHEMYIPRTFKTNLKRQLNAAKAKVARG